MSIQSNRALFGGTLLAAGLILGSAANADIYTDRSAFEAANPGLANLDFEGIAAPGTYLQPAPDFSPYGAAFTSSGSGAAVAIADSGFFFYTPTDVLFVNLFDGPLEITFSPLVQAAGMDIAIGFGGLGATVRVFDSGGGLLESTSFDTEPESVFTTFIGFDNLGDIGQIVVTPDSGGFVMVDNVTYGIPAPGAAALLGIGGLVAARRRR